MNIYERARERLDEFDHQVPYGPYKHDGDREMWMACYLGALSEILRQLLDEVGEPE